jgi:hypothetical protein
MKNLGMALIFAVLTLGMGAASFGAADPSANPFQGIPRANVFGLHEPPGPIATPPPPIPLPPMKLTGVLDGWGKLVACLEVGVPPAPPNPAKTSFLTLSPGESADGVEVLIVNAKAGTAQVKVMNVVTNLTLNSNVPPAPATSARPAPALNRQLPRLPSGSPAAGLSRDQNALVIEAERERLHQADDLRANLMPVTHLTPTGAPGTETPSPSMTAHP